MKLLAGPASYSLSRQVERLWRQSVSKPIERLPSRYDRHPDGRLRSRFKPVGEKEEILVIQSTPTEDDFVYLLQALAFYSENPMRVVMPYFGYARQDTGREVKDGWVEACGARAVARTIDAPVYVVNPHSREAIKYFRTVTEPIDASEIIGKYFAGKPGRFVFVSPDNGAINMAKKAAAAQGKAAKWDALDKTRVSPRDVEIEKKEIDVAGANVIFIDDMISTGDTIEKAAELAREAGAAEIYAACVHGIFVGDAVGRLLNAGVSKILTTDTIEGRFDWDIERLSVAPLIVAALAK